jgi:hypothetical protein
MQALVSTILSLCGTAMRSIQVLSLKLFVSMTSVLPSQWADRVAHPRRRQIGAVLAAVRVDLPHEVVVLEDHQHAARQLE